MTEPETQKREMSLFFAQKLAIKLILSIISAVIIAAVVEFLVPT